jgi:short-subunit dehydrogenase
MGSFFQGKTVIVTGASMGVGAACARAFAAEGANLVLVARGEARLQKLASELEGSTSILAVAMDVADESACIDLLTQSNERFGRIDVLVNNAGMHNRGAVDTLAPADIAAMIDVNLRAPLFLSAAVLPYLQAQSGGAIVMVGSLAGRTPMQGAATYAASKAGLRSFSYAFADELREQGIHVGVVSPGPIDTGFIMDEIDDVEDIVFSQPISTAEQVADNVLAIARGEADEISMPPVSGFLTTLSYLFPRLRRGMRERLYAMGRKNKDKIRASKTADTAA